MTGSASCRGPLATGSSCTLLADIRLERGTGADWLALAPLHYRSHHTGAVTDVFRLLWRGPGTGRPVLVGAIVYGYVPLSSAARDRATGGRYATGGLGRVSMARLLNRELRIIRRVVIAPNWRGLGLASRLVAGTLRQVGTPYVEAQAVMGRIHPFFERAGMTAYPPVWSRQGERLRAALEAAGLRRMDRRSADRLGRALDALAEPERRLVEPEIDRWARAYLGAKNHRLHRPDRARAFALVARHLDSAPVYYLWKREDRP